MSKNLLIDNLTKELDALKISNKKDNNKKNDKLIIKDKKLMDWIQCGNIFTDLYEKSRRKKTSTLAKNYEKSFGHNMLKTYYNVNSTKTNQWTTQLGESIVKTLLILNGELVWRPKKKGKYCPDWETEKNIYEVKTRTYTISGTAGEKILGVPYKYAEVPKLYKKPLKIVCVAYQEKEAIDNFKLFNPDCEEKRYLLKSFKKLKIEFIKASDLIPNQ